MLLYWKSRINLVCLKILFTLSLQFAIADTFYDYFHNFVTANMKRKVRLYYDQPQ